MKNNTKQAKQLLTQALRAIPEDFALSDAKRHVRLALNNIITVESRREKREQQRQLQELNSSFMQTVEPLGNPQAIKEVLGVIDDMIEAEKRKLDEIKQNRQKKVADDNNDIQSLFG